MTGGRYNFVDGIDLNELHKIVHELNKMIQDCKNEDKNKKPLTQVKQILEPIQSELQSFLTSFEPKWKKINMLLYYLDGYQTGDFGIEKIQSELQKLNILF